MTKRTAPQRWQDAKRMHRNSVVLVRVGDFYETFLRDADLIAHFLELTVTKATLGSQSVSMTGFPYYQLDAYRDTLKSHGFPVEVIEESEAAI